MPRKISTEAVINWIRLKLQSSLSTPPSGFGYLGVKSDKHLWFKDSTGLETDLMGAGSDSSSVAGPASSTNNAVVLFDGASGKLVKNSSATYDSDGFNIASGLLYKINGSAHAHTESEITFTDIATNNSSITKHGYLPKLSGDSTAYLNGDGEWTIPPAGGTVYDSDIIFSDITTNNASISKHGFLPKLSGDSGTYLNGDGEFTTPPGGGSGTLSPKYIVAASDSDLTNEIVIPGLAGSPDVSGIGGAGTSEEYDTATTGLSWTPSTPNTVDSNTTIKSHLYIKATTNTEYFGTKSWTPAGAFDARCKISGLGNGVDNLAAIGLHIGDSDNSDRLLIQIQSYPNFQVFQAVAYTYTSGSYTQRGGTWNCNDYVYFRIARDGSNNCSFYFSSNGLLWQLIATQSFTLTVSDIGFRVSQAAALTHEMAIDWLRTSV
jgi:hypothetical protein